MYQPLFSSNFEKRIKKFPTKEQAKILEKITDILNDPRKYSIKLETTKPSIYRLRVGEYRVFFLLNENPNVIKIVDVLRRTSQTYS